MPDGPNVAGMVADPDFQSLTPADKRAALTKVTGDQSFAGLNDGETMQFVSRFQKPANTSAPPSPFTPGDFQTMQGSPIYNQNRLGSQPLPYSSMGAAVSGAMARGQMPNFPQQVQQAGSDAAGYAPAIGATVGGVGGLPGMALGAGAGTIAEARMKGQQSSARDVATNAAITYAGGKLLDLGVGAVSKYGGRAIERLAGVPQAQADAVATQDAALTQRTYDLRDNASKYQQAVSDNAAANMKAQGEFQQSQEDALRQRDIAARQNRAKFEGAQSDLASANAEKQAKYRDDLAKAVQRIPAAPQGEQELWVDLNKSIQASPNKIRVKLGATDLDSAVTMPGRGLAAEGLKATDLATMTPVEQNAAIAPKWNAAGQAVDAVVAKATAAGKTVNLYKLDEAIDGLEDPQARERIHSVVNRVGTSLGIRDWGNVTPTQALQLRRELWNAGGNGEYVSRAISDELRSEVDGLKGIDQHYSDLNAAMTAVRDNLKKYAAKTFKLPQMNPDLPEPPKLAEFQHPSYSKLPQIPTNAPQPIPLKTPALKTPTEVPWADLDAIRRAQLLKLGGRAAKGAATTVGLGTGAKLGELLYQAITANASKSR